MVHSFWGHDENKVMWLLQIDFTYRANDSIVLVF